jgi:ribosomal protein L23
MSKAPKTAAAIKPEHYDLIKKPIITEKATMASEAGAVVFQVAMDSTKPQIKEAVEAIFGVKVKPRARPSVSAVAQASVRTRRRPMSCWKMVRRSTSPPASEP